MHHQLPEPAQIHVHQVGSAIQPFHTLSSPSPPAFNLSQHRVFSNESVLHSRHPKYWSFSFSINHSNEYSGLISFRIDCFDLLAVQESSPIPLFESTISLGLSFLYPLQCSCLENPRDGGAWWAAVSGVAQSRTQLKRLSSSSSFLYSITLTSIHD